MNEPFADPRVIPPRALVPLLVCLALLTPLTPALGQGVSFVRGDVNDDGLYDVADGVFLLANLFSGGEAPHCEDSADANADGVKDIADGITILSSLFSGGPLPSAPHPSCGTAPVLLGCATFDSCPACALPGGAGCVGLSEADCLAAGGVPGGPGSSCLDSDGDRIPDAFELADCTSTMPGFAGTDPLVADTDQDGIDDGDEFYGTIDGLDLPGLGVDPCRKDILVETDWVFTSGQPADRNRLAAGQADRLVAAFDDAPVPNPSGVPGIRLHIDRGQSPDSEGNAVQDPDSNGQIDFPASGLNGGEFSSIKAVHFAPNRSGYFHYCLMCDAYGFGGGTQNSSGLAEILGDDFVVSMGQWAIGNDDRIGNTLMHELGHNLGLRHGGFQNLNFKPNYNSVMNYSYQMCGTDTDSDAIPDGGLDFSRAENATLDENALVESDGVTGAGPGIDWNGDGDTDDVLSGNINCRVTDTYANSSCSNFNMQTNTCGIVGACGDSLCNLLADHDDWGNLELDHLDDLDFIPPELIHCWITP